MLKSYLNLFPNNLNYRPTFKEARFIPERLS
jgi:hypothetical protein